MNPLDDSNDLAGILATDAWLDSIGQPATPHGDALSLAMADWLAEIDGEYREPVETVRPSPLHARRFAAQPSPPRC